ncbi:MAG: Flp family type IVb pilin [Dehalococcoidia bacterium]
MIRELKQFWQDESGPELVEWAVVTIILLVAAVLAYRVIGDELRATLESIRDWIKCVREGSACPGG